MSFNSRSYIKTAQEAGRDEPNQSFSSEAYARARKAAEVPQVGGGETALMSAVSGIPLGTLVKNFGVTGLLKLLGPEPGAQLPASARAELEAMGEKVEEPKGLLDTYRDVRDKDRERLNAGSQQNPNAARAGTAAGLALSLGAPLPGVSLVGKGAAAGVKGASHLARLRTVGSAAATGAAYGALGGATDGEADLTRGDVGGVLRDTVAGGAKGAAWGTAGGAVGLGAQALLPRLLRYLKVRSSKEAIQSNSNIGAATRKPMRDESAELMIDDNQIRAGRDPKQTMDRIIASADLEGDRLGRIIRELEASGYTGPEAESLARQLEAQAAELSPRISSDKSPVKVFEDEASNIRNVPRPRPAAAPLSGYQPAPRTLGLAQAEGIKSSIQGRAPFAKIESTEKGDALKQASRTVRLATESSLREQAAAKDMDARRAFEELGTSASDMEAMGVGRAGGARVQQFIDQKDRLGKYLDAAQFAKRGGSKYDQRPRVGLLDTIEAQKADSVLGSKLLARALAEVRGRSASTAAVAFRDGQRFFSSPESSAAFGRAAGDAGEHTEEELGRWADEHRPEDDEKLSPLARALVQAYRGKRKE